MQKYALILFDEDGCTATVETRKLRGDGPLCQSSQCTLGLTVGQQYLVEILQLSDSKMELNKYEAIWARSERSAALDREKKRRGRELNGFLSVWPEGKDIGLALAETETNTESVENVESVSTRKTGPNRKTAVKTKATQKSTTKTTQKSTTKTTQKSTIMGTNSRKITVLFEGGGDYSCGFSEPGRDPYYTNNLTIDQSELLQLQVTEHSEGKRSFSTQTETVVVMDNESEVKSLVGGKCQCDSLRDMVMENSSKLDRLTELVCEVKTMMEAKFDNSLVSVSLLESINTNIQDIGTENAGVIQEQQITEEKGHETGNTKVANGQEVESFLYVAEPVQNLNHIYSHESQPVCGVKRCFSLNCSLGPIVEIFNSEVPAGDIEIRIPQEMQRRTKQLACSVGNFGWLLAKQVYTTEELLGRNYHGPKGKYRLSPRRLHAIEHAAVDVFGEGDNVKELATAINTALRNLHRTPFRPLNFN